MIIIRVIDFQLGQYGDLPTWY